MLSVHFNGEMVRHADMKLIHARVAERLEKEGRCKFGMTQIRCYEYIKAAVEYNKSRGKSPEICPLSCSEKCPCHKKRKESGNKEKTFTMDWKTYRKISSAAHWMLKESPYRTLFLTLTFPKYRDERFDKCKNKFCQKVFENETNKCFSKFAENLRRNYQCDHYIAVKERGKNTDRLHFHLLASFPFVDFKRINRAWIHAISDISENSGRALYSDKKARFIKSPRAATRYVCKYFNKSFGVKNATRVIFISNNTLKEPVRIKEEGFNHIDLLKGIQYSFKKYDHVTVFKVTKDAEYEKFCEQFLYPLFECSCKNRNFYYVPTG